MKSTKSQDSTTSANSTTSTDWLNYHHLYYFWKVAQEGSLSRAAEQLRLSHSTLSTQVRALESMLGGELFLRSGRALSLTVLGKDVLAYANEIFRIGGELVEMAAGRASAPRVALSVGVVEAVPRAVAYRFVEPVLRLPLAAPLSVRQDRFESLLEEMAGGRLHLILSDRPPPQGCPVHLYCTTLWESPIRLYGAQALYRRYAPQFPASLAGAPLLLPARLSRLRQLLDEWLSERGVQIELVGEFDNADTLCLFGCAGHGLFPVGTALLPEVERHPGVVPLGELPGLRDRIYAITTERRARRSEIRLLMQEAARSQQAP